MKYKIVSTVWQLVQIKFTKEKYFHDPGKINQSGTVSSDLQSAVNSWIHNITDGSSSSGGVGDDADDPLYRRQSMENLASKTRYIQISRSGDADVDSDICCGCKTVILQETTV